MKQFVDPEAIYLYRDPVDFRKSINGLAAIVEDELNVPLMNGALFLFCNRQKDKIKILYWDKTGFVLWYKRLEKEKFKWPNTSHLDLISLDEFKLNQLLSGFTILGHQKIETDEFSMI